MFFKLKTKTSIITDVLWILYSIYEHLIYARVSCIASTDMTAAAEKQIRKERAMSDCFNLDIPWKGMRFYQALTSDCCWSKQQSNSYDSVVHQK